MISSRTVIFSLDEAKTRPWVGALSATGSTVDVVTDVANIGPKTDLLVAEAPSGSDELSKKLSEMSRPSSAVIVLPEPNLMAAVGYLQHPVVQSVLVKDYIDSALLTGVSARLLTGNIFGISKAVPWGVRVYSEIVGSHDDRLQALATLGRFASTLKLRAKFREAVDVVADELLMNSLYDAPIDSEGKQVFAEVDPSQRSGMRLERPSVLQFASDGRRLILAVRDSFGSLDRATVLRNLERCAKASDQIDRKTMGAGLGLYLVANHVSELVFNVLPGVATEATAVIDLRRPGQQLSHVGFYQELVKGADASTQDGGSGAHVLPSSRQVAAPQGPPQRVIQLTLVAAILALLLAGVLLVWPYFRPATTGTLEVTTEPAGAVVRVNGVRKGVASPTIKIGDVAADAPVSVTAHLEGYTSGEEVVSVARGGSRAVKLVLPREQAKVRVTSAPPGATILIDGQDSGQKTPALLEGLVAGKQLEINLTRHGFVESIGTVTPMGTQPLIYHTKLPLAPGFAMIGLESTPPGAHLWLNDVDTGEVTPVSGFVVRARQRYKVKLIADGMAPWELEWFAKDGARMVKNITMAKGGQLTLTSNIPGTVYVAEMEFQLPLTERTMPSGSHLVRIRGRSPLVDYSFRVNIAADEHVTRDLVFGFVTTKSKKWRIKLPGSRPAFKAAFRPGSQTITFIGRAGQLRTGEVKVKPNATQVVDVAQLTGAKKPAKKAAGAAARKAAARHSAAAAKTPAADEEKKSDKKSDKKSEKKPDKKPDK